MDKRAIIVILDTEDISHQGNHRHHRPQSLRLTLNHRYQSSTLSVTSQTSVIKVIMDITGVLWHNHHYHITVTKAVVKIRQASICQFLNHITIMDNSVTKDIVSSLSLRTLDILYGWIWNFLKAGFRPNPKFRKTRTKLMVTSGTNR